MSKGECVVVLAAQCVHIFLPCSTRSGVSGVFRKIFLVPCAMLAISLESDMRMGVLIDCSGKWSSGILATLCTTCFDCGFMS